MKIIFLAEDDLDDREFFTDALLDIGIESTLTTAINGMELMATLDETVIEPPPPHVIFLDLNMPHKNGFECLEEIRNSPKLKNIPVAIFSTTASENAIETTFALGANCFVCKPTSHTLLKRAIETVLAFEFWHENNQLSKENFLLSIK